jgi:hypothetical protein
MEDTRHWLDKRASFQRQAFGERISLAGRNNAALSHAPININPERTQIGTKMNQPTTAIVARTTRDIRVDCNSLTNPHPLHTPANLFYNSGIFVSKNNRWS